MFKKHHWVGSNARHISACLSIMEFLFVFEWHLAVNTGTFSNGALIPSMLRRVLEKGEFAAFIQSWCLGTGTDFDEMSNELIQRLSDQDFVKEEVQDAVGDFQDASPQEVTICPRLWRQHS